MEEGKKGDQSCFWWA